MNTGLDGRTAIVGGASAGLGFATAKALALEGANVLMVSRSPERIRAAASRIREGTGGRAEGFAADLADPASPAAIAAAAEERFGPADVLVINGGGPASMPASTVSADDFEAAMRLLLLPAQRLVEAVLPGMRARHWGRIVAITSIAVREPQPGLVLSNALRAAVTGYLKTLSGEVAADGVTVNAVCPGFTATERLKQLAGDVARREGTPVDEVFESWAQRAAVKRLLDPDEVAAAVAFLASAPASGITGVSLPVDGGFGSFLV
ncbi:MAG: SDR family oxidoreductase [Acidobacteria bacterium]|nr:SDR family oxidoreductase [Acidobacteriota bacterium]